MHQLGPARIAQPERAAALPAEVARSAGERFAPLARLAQQRRGSGRGASAAHLQGRRLRAPRLMRVAAAAGRLAADRAVAVHERHRARAPRRVKRHGAAVAGSFEVHGSSGCGQQGRRRKSCRARRRKAREASITRTAAAVDAGRRSSVHSPDGDDRVHRRRQHGGRDRRRPRRRRPGCRLDPRRRSGRGGSAKAWRAASASGAGRRPTPRSRGARWSSGRSSRSSFAAAAAPCARARRAARCSSA